MVTQLIEEEVQHEEHGTHGHDEEAHPQRRDVHRHGLVLVGVGRLRVRDAPLGAARDLLALTLSVLAGTTGLRVDGGPSLLLLHMTEEGDMWT